MRFFRLLFISGALVLRLFSLSSLLVRAQEKTADKLAPYYPTPESMVDKMLQLGGLKAGEKMFDLGSGDGRLVIAAARKYKADATAWNWTTRCTSRAWTESRAWVCPPPPALSTAICLSRIILRPIC